MSRPYARLVLFIALVLSVVWQGGNSFADPPIKSISTCLKDDTEPVDGPCTLSAVSPACKLAPGGVEGCDTSRIYTAVFAGKFRCKELPQIIIPPFVFGHLCVDDMEVLPSGGVVPRTGPCVTQSNCTYTIGTAPDGGPLALCITGAPFQ